MLNKNYGIIINDMLRKLMKLFKLKAALPFIGFAALCILFYYALIDALHKHKDNPIIIPTHKGILSAEEVKLRDLYEKGLKWSALKRKDKMEKLLENPVYAYFNISKVERKRNVTILVIVSSGPRRADRRKVIRETWWKQCILAKGVRPECIFFTDRQKPGDKFYTALMEESGEYKDMQFQPLRGGIEFGIRFLYHLVWAMTNYNFDYLLRADDDYFFCMERFLYELPMPMLKRFHWGFTHCIQEIVRPEESVILLSRDLIAYFLSQKPQAIRCHPWADQMLGVWTNDLNENNLYRHDYRLHHAPVVDQSPELRKIKNVCNKFIGIHGTYPEDMKLFWKNKGPGVMKFKSEQERDKVIGNLVTNSEVCELVHNFNYLVFEREWQYEPQRCIYFPIWNTAKQKVIGGVYSGRQEDKRLAEDDLKLKVKINDAFFNSEESRNHTSSKRQAYHIWQTNETRVETDEPRVETDKPLVETVQPRIETDEPRIETVKRRVKQPLQNILRVSEHSQLTSKVLTVGKEISKRKKSKNVKKKKRKKIKKKKVRM